MTNKELFIVPESNKETFPQEGFLVHYMKDLVVPSVVSSGDLNMAKTLLKEVVSKMKKTVTEAFEESAKQSIALSSNEAVFSAEELLEEETAPEIFPEPTKDSGENEFFRYVRKLDINGNSATFSGVTFLIHLYPAERKFSFSMAYCRDNERFDKRIARSICKNRAENGIWHEVSDFDDSISVVANIYKAIGRTLLQIPSNPDIISTSPRLSIVAEHRSSVIELKKVYKYISHHYSPVDNLSYLAVME